MYIFFFKWLHSDMVTTTVTKTFLEMNLSLMWKFLLLNKNSVTNNCEIQCFSLQQFALYYAHWFGRAIVQSHWNCCLCRLCLTLILMTECTFLYDRLWIFLTNTYQIWNTLHWNLEANKKKYICFRSARCCSDLISCWD